MKFQPKRDSVQKLFQIQPSICGDNFQVIYQ